MLALSERFDGGRDIFVLDAALATKVLDVGELVDTDGMFPVEGDAVEGFAGGEGLFGGFVLDEGVAVCKGQRSQVYSEGGGGRKPYPSVIPVASSTGMKTLSGLILPTSLSFLHRNLMSLDFWSWVTTGQPSTTMNVSRPSSSRTSCCSRRSRGCQWCVWGK